MFIAKLLVASLVCVTCFSAMAQWQWIDKDGHRVFSDRAPPTQVPEKNILTQPKPHREAIEPALNAATSKGAAPESVTAKPAGVDNALLDRKKQAVASEAARRKSEDERYVMAQAESCQRARLAKSGLDAGLRISRTNANAEREFLEGAARELEAQRLQNIIDADCK